MRIYIRMKVAGKRRDVLEQLPVDLPETIDTAESLITHLVQEKVKEYNQKQVDAPLLHYLTQKELAGGEAIGKISFGDRKNEQPQEERQAVENALECFRDGLYRLLINETEVEHLGAITLRENDTVTFIRLVMLAGRRW